MSVDAARTSTSDPAAAEAPHHHPELTTTADGVILSSDADAELLGMPLRGHALVAPLPMMTTKLIQPQRYSQDGL